LRHVVQRREYTRTTWQFRLAVMAVLVLGLWLTRGWWTVAIGRSLVCEANRGPSDALLLENFDPDYLIFERATTLLRAGLASRIVVPVRVEADSGRPNAVALGTAELMARIAWTGPFEAVPIREVEPISLNAARELLTFLLRERIRSVTVVTPLFRSRRSALVYGAVFGPAGIAVRCEPVEGTTGVVNWSNTLHGIQGVLEQWGKLQYYRFYVLPFAPGRAVRAASSRPDVERPGNRSTR
jgi:hypothetical protein